MGNSLGLSSAVYRKGFTLLEVMVVLVIFALIAMGSSGVLLTLLRSQAVIEQRQGQLETLQRLIMITRHDMSQAAPSMPALPQDANQAYPYLSIAENGPLAFSRLGWRNPLQEERSTLAYVRYSYANERLLRQLWPFAQPQNSTPAVSQALASDVTEVHLHSAPVTDSSGTALATPLPAALEIDVTLQSLGEVRQLIPLVQAP